MKPMARIRFKKLRLWLVYPFFLVYFFVARVTDFSFFIGVVFMCLGMFLRFWASGYISKSRTLATSGPYAYTRNPLYLGNFILGFGISFISNNIWLIIYYLVSFSILYLGTIKEEEKVLKEKFGDAYLNYIASVPVFFPFAKAYKHSDKKRFDINLSFKNGEFIRFYGFSLLILSFYLWRSFVLKKEHLEKTNTTAIFIFVVFLFLLCFNILIRRRSERRHV